MDGFPKDIEGGPWASDFDLIRRAMRKATDVALGFARRSNAVRRKADGSPVTDADLAVDACLAGFLKGERPDYGWLSEETAEHAQRGGRPRVWIVDPIDGTSTFVQGGDEWTIGVALVEDGQPVAASIVNPVRGEVFEAVKGRGAFLNGQPIHVARRTEPTGALVSTAGNLGSKAARLSALSDVKLVTVTSALYRFALLAAGRLDAAIALSSKHEWDVAPGALLVAEAGGVVSTPAGSALRFNSEGAKVEGFVASNAILHQMFVRRPETSV